MAEPADEARGPAGDEAQIDAIISQGRATRRRPARGAWIAAAIVGAICAIGFVLLLVPGAAPGGDSSDRPAADGSGAGPRAAPRRTAGRAGCAGGLGVGLGIGLGIGFGIGFAMGRRQAGPRDHSSRSSP
ncbi:MAG TPA: hypothetical protein VNO30_06310 [Kofleriaceae bacterium]|nr:hypothetical protein [Kofleriaceae bacterium]